MPPSVNYSNIGPEVQVNDLKQSEGYLSPKWSDIAVIHTRISKSLFDNSQILKKYNKLIKLEVR